MPRPTSYAIAQRRALVAELSRDTTLSLRDIAKKLGVTKDVIYRDRLANTAAATATRTALHRDKADQAATAMAQLHAAVTATAAARPAYQFFIDDETAAQWLAQLRDDVATLQAVADSFRDYYPHLTSPTATPGP